MSHEIIEEMSGTVTCECGWSSTHHPIALDAVKEYVLHKEGMTDAEILAFWHGVITLDNLGMEP